MTAREKKREWAMRLGGVISVLGAGLVVRGMWLAWHPGGWMLAGALIAAPGLFVAYDAFRSE